jgi:hypothetical protein
MVLVCLVRKGQKSAMEHDVHAEVYRLGRHVTVIFGHVSGDMVLSALRSYRLGGIYLVIFTFMTKHLHLGHKLLRHIDECT